ncbi:MAG: 3-hydroxyacyl-CoA dehydrogenase family protein [Saccharofermentanales bacterium]|jgi:3-hydroxybutyryl-CoA dehydrogenase
MKVFVAGCGTMGSGIAQTFAVHGHDVVMFDQTMDFVDRGHGMLERQLRRQEQKGRMRAEDVEQTLARLTKSVDLRDAAEADLVIEAIFEDMHAKRELLTGLDAVCPPECIFGSNTSSLSITEMAQGLNHEANVVGIHFFNPAPVMKLVELIRGAATSDATLERAQAIAEAIGKEPVICRESPGFIVNRVLIPMINEAVHLLDTGVARREDIDTAMRLGANHPMGPLQLADFIGIDIVLNIMETLFNETGDPKYRPSLLLKQMVRAGKLGRKSGEGFYPYNA